VSTKCVWSLLYTRTDATINLAILIWDATVIGLTLTCALEDCVVAPDSRSLARCSELVLELLSLCNKLLCGLLQVAHLLLLLHSLDI